MLTTILATVLAFGGQLPPPPTVAMFGNEWAVQWDGRTYAGDDPTQLILLLIEGPDPPTDTDPIGQCFRACHTLCNTGMPSGAPNAVCWAAWINGACICGCRLLTGDCPPFPTLPSWSKLDLLVESVNP